MMKYWLATKGCPDDEQFKRMIGEKGHMFIALNEDCHGHGAPKVMQDVVTQLTKCDPDNIGILMLFTLCTDRSHEHQMMSALHTLYDPLIKRIGDKNIRSHIIYVDGDEDPEELDSSLWQRLIPWWYAYDASTRVTMIFNNVIYGDESRKVSTDYIEKKGDVTINENIDVTSMGRTMQKIASSTQKMNGNTIVLYPQEQTTNEIGDTIICLV